MKSNIKKIIDERNKKFEENGWVIDCVITDDNYGYIHTHGLNYDHPEIMCVVENDMVQVVGSCVNTVGNWIVEGQKIELNRRYPKVIKNLDVIFINPTQVLNFKIPEDMTADIKSYIIMVLPDSKNRFPWEDNYLDEPKGFQPIYQLSTHQ